MVSPIRGSTYCIYTCVGFCVACSTGKGNAKASSNGTGNKYRLPRFLVSDQCLPGESEAIYILHIMIPVYKGIAMFMLCMLPPSADSFAQSPAIEMEDYTSDISFVTSSDASVVQQLGSPLLIPEMNSGDTQLYQGLFALLTGVSSSSTDVSSVFIDNNSVEIVYDPIRKALIVKTDANIGNSRLNVIDIDGNVYANDAVNGYETVINLSHLPAGTYAAGICSSNKYFKTLKFIVK